MRGVRGEEPGSVLRVVGSGLGAAGSRVRAAGSVPRVPGCGQEVSAACAASARGCGLPGGGAGKSLWAGTAVAAGGALLPGPRGDCPSVDWLDRSVPSIPAAARRSVAAVSMEREAEGVRTSLRRARRRPHGAARQEQSLRVFKRPGCCTVKTKPSSPLISKLNHPLLQRKAVLVAKGFKIRLRGKDIYNYCLFLIILRIVPF